MLITCPTVTVLPVLEVAFELDAPSLSSDVRCGLRSQIKGESWVSGSILRSRMFSSSHLCL